MADDVVTPPSVTVPKPEDPQQAVDAVLATAVPTSPVPTPVPTPPPVSSGSVPLPPLPPSPIVSPLTTTPVMTEELPLGLTTPGNLAPPINISDPITPGTIGTVPVPLPLKPKKGRKVLAFVAGFVLLISGILGGFAYYSRQFQAVDPVIAGVLTQSYDKTSCHGCLRGGKLVWRGGECVQSGTCNANDADLQWLEIRDEAKCNQAGGVYCAGCKGFCNISKDRGCNDLQVAKCNELPQYGANWVKATNGSCPGGYSKKCNCGTSDYCFDKEGYCGNETGPGVSQDTLDHGLCQITDDPKKQGDGIADKINDGTGTEIFFCANRFDNLSAGCQDQLVGSDFNLNCYCGTVQIDKPGQGFETKSMQCGCKDDTKLDTNRAMSCTGITRSPTTVPKIGDKLTFTCAGKLTGVPNATLSYKFRYQIDTGSYKTLTNKTATTAELFVAACGTYKVQCQACVTVLKVTKCDPTWQGATQ